MFKLSHHASLAHVLVLISKTLGAHDLVFHGQKAGHGTDYCWHHQFSKVKNTGIVQII